MNTNETKDGAFQRLQMAVLSDTFDGTISKGGRAELVHAFNAFKSEHDALRRVAEVARHVSNDWDDAYHDLQSALAALDKLKEGK